MNEPLEWKSWVMQAHMEPGQDACPACQVVRRRGKASSKDLYATVLVLDEMLFQQQKLTTTLTELVTNQRATKAHA